MNGIRVLSEGTFDGLLELEELDMKNNPVIGTGLPKGIFDYLPRLRRLQISGYITGDSKLSSYGNLRNLRDIVITPDAFKMPNGLAKLEKIKVIYFAFCSNFNNLTQFMLESFNKTNIEELNIFMCSVKTIENGTFNGFASLITLNFARNRDLDVNYVIDAL
ncbi:hypothetical protein LSH36_675g02005 [Paralvinella palmiformis]|uniref:Uncharacterized protein n=1 Tax=Paralvinella palmiformis TaxID=53620 RepID=A0AAD9J2U9_9ANNE|nr:hypothetical protein LSH36_675g02005 [Paralvinella palmiformis]